MNTDTRTGHLAAIVTVLLWGTTFVSTKTLLTVISPIDILLLRFGLGFFALVAVYPRRMPRLTIRQELYFAVAGLCGVCLYYLLENIALTHTTASNVGVIVSVNPCFTALFSRLVSRDGERLSGTFFLGFVLAMAGICVISFMGSGVQFDPLGDLLAFLAAVCWAVYSVLTKKLGEFGGNDVQTTRRVFFYGILWIFLAIRVMDFGPDLLSVTPPVFWGNPLYLANLLYLGLGASALCFVTWGVAVGKLGAVKTSIYIYLVPVITVISAALILKESLTPVAWLGVGLTLLGLVVSQWKGKVRA